MALGLDLPEELWWSIFMKLTPIHHHVRFGGVCRQWRSIVMENRRVNIPTHVPGLVIPASNSSQTSQFLPYPVGKNMDQDLPILSIPHQHSCRGSYQGWLFILTDTRDVYLHNPLTGARIKLPPLTGLPPSWNVKRAILSASPSAAASECSVVVFSGPGYVVYCKAGYNYWKPLSGPNWGCVNGIFYQKKFYLVDDHGDIFICPFISIEPNLTVPGLQPPKTADSSSKRYLVELDGELLQLVRSGNSLAETTKFEVFKLETSGPKWNKVKDLNGGAIFIGTNQSFALPSSNLTEGYKGDRIYFTDDSICDEHTCMILGQDPYLQSPAISGVFLLGDDKYEPLYSTDSRTTRLSPPIWITPVPW